MNRLREIFQEKWEQEPDFVDLLFGEYHFVIYRHPYLRHLNGYVGITKNHPYYGKDMYSKEISELKVHGGITFSNKRICEGFKESFWYFGFDTAHIFDYIPYFQKLENDPSFKKLNNIIKMLSIGQEEIMIEENYKDIQYVLCQVIELYEQLRQAQDNLSI